MSRNIKYNHPVRSLDRPKPTDYHKERSKRYMGKKYKQRGEVEKKLVAKCGELYKDYLAFNYWASMGTNETERKKDKATAERLLNQWLTISSFLEEIGKPIHENTFSRWQNEVKKEVVSDEH